jgi:hypothetical protein
MVLVFLLPGIRYMYIDMCIEDVRVVFVIVHEEEGSS